MGLEIVEHFDRPHHGRTTEKPHPSTKAGGAFLRYVIEIFW